MATAVDEIEGPLSPPSCCTSINSKAASAKSKSTDDLAAMRHLRSVIESITSNENMSLAERKTKLANLEHLFLTAERQLLFHDGAAESPPSIKDADVKKIKKVGWLKSVLRGKQDGNSRKNTVVATKPIESANSKRCSGVLEALDKETLVVEAQEARDDVENKVANTVTTCVRDAPLTSPGVGGGDNETDSIMELRMQNSEAFLASVCSLRSLWTFERDFINNIIAEQAEANNSNNNDEKSTTTFEKDFLARMKNKSAVDPPHPTQVFVNSNGINPDDDHDDLTLDTQLSETTFENDVRCGMKNGGDGMILPPAHIITPTKQNYRDSDDSSIATFLSETTFEHDQRKIKESSVLNGKLQAAVERSAQPTSFALHIENTLSIDDSQISVSTYEKDVAALNALAEKIGRKPSTQSKVVMEGIMSSASDRSCSTFEQDYGYITATQRAIRIPAPPPPQRRRSEQLSRVAATIRPKQQPPNETRSSAGAGVSLIWTPLSTTAFENDMIDGGPQANQNYSPEWFTGIDNRKKGPQRNVGSTKKKNVVAPSSLDNRSMNPDLSDAMRQANAKADAMVAAKRQQSKISPLDVQLSQYRVSTVRGGKSRKEEWDSTVLSKFLCQAEQFIFKY